MEKRREKLCIALTKGEKQMLKTLSIQRGESYAVCVRDLIRLAFKQCEFSQHRKEEVSHEESVG